MSGAPDLDALEGLDAATIGRLSYLWSSGQHELFHRLKTQAVNDAARRPALRPEPAAYPRCEKPFTLDHSHLQLAAALIASGVRVEQYAYDHAGLVVKFDDTETLRSVADQFEAGTLALPAKALLDAFISLWSKNAAPAMSSARAHVIAYRPAPRY